MRAMWQIDQDERTIGYYERGSRRVCDVVDCAVLRPELQAKLEEVRATEWSQFPPDLKHLDVVAGEPRYGDFKYAINNSFGFGGHNVALAFGRY